MLRLSKSIRLWICLSFAGSLICYCQTENYYVITDSIANKIERINGHKYYVSGVDIDRSVDNPAIAHGKIKEPYHTLVGKFFFLAEGETNADLSKPKGFVGIYSIKLDSIVWRSALLSSYFTSGPGSSVDIVDELNQDGKVEIVVGQATGATGITVQLWIFSWDGTEGKLITQLDSYGESEIMYWGDKYEVKDVDGDGIYEIEGKWEKGDGSDTKVIVTYAWNGSLYGKWGKTSKELLKGKKK